MPNVPKKAENLHEKGFVKNGRKVKPGVMPRKYNIN